MRSISGISDLASVQVSACAGSSGSPGSEHGRRLDERLMENLNTGQTVHNASSSGVAGPDQSLEQRVNGKRLVKSSVAGRQRMGSEIVKMCFPLFKDLFTDILMSF